MSEGKGKGEGKGRRRGKGKGEEAAAGSGETPGSEGNQTVGRKGRRRTDGGGGGEEKPAAVVDEKPKRRPRGKTSGIKAQAKMFAGDSAGATSKSASKARSRRTKTGAAKEEAEAAKKFSPTVLTEQALTDFFTVNNPEKVASIPTLMDTLQGTPSVTPSQYTL
jgi:hypothetical protein